jgi:glycosyltransferase involved in cell wall biosynthesis
VPSSLFAGDSAVSHFQLQKNEGNPTARNPNLSISVVIPVFNRRQLIGAALESVLAQDFPEIDIAVVDNHSDDGTWELLQTYDDPRVRLFRNDRNIGLFGNFNRCAEEIRREYALFLCSDDRLAPGFLRPAIALLDRYPSAALLSSRGVLVNGDGKRNVIADCFPRGLYHGASVPSAWFWANYNYGANPFNYPSGIVIRTSALNRCLPFRAEIGAGADIDLFLRVLGYGDLLISDEIGCFVVRHGGQESLLARSKGALVNSEFALLSAFEAELQRAGTYDEINRQMACTVLGEVLRNARSGIRQALATSRSFGRRPIEMFNAAMRRAILTSIYRISGVRFSRHLKPVVGADVFNCS